MIPSSLQRPELAPLWQAFHARLSSGRPVSRVRVGPLTTEQQAAVADLLGLSRLPGPNPRVALARLEALLSPLGLSVSSIVEATCGPIGNAAADQAAQSAAEAQLWSWLSVHPVVHTQPALLRWVADLQSRRRIDSSVERTRSIIEQALGVLAALPYDGRPLAHLAESCTGDPHALDGDSQLAVLVLRALAVMYDEPAPSDAESRRFVWERAGVACDALSTVVLAAGLRPTGIDALSRSLRDWANVGQASALTLAQLRTATSLDIGPVDVHVVENPSILAMALQRFGNSCPPVVCTAGWPNGAGMLLLRLLGDNQLHYHGDFDPDGVRIAAHILAATGGRPWCMSASDYRSAASLDKPHPRFNPGRLPDAPWDDELATAMRERAITVPEEHVADILLADLAHDVR
ncbi:MAG: TIGR02679 family protein [Mycobacterium sp.]|nr:TIGR02679 family protein [Mycobacterium sp.]